MTALLSPPVRRSLGWRAIGFALAWLVVAGATAHSWLIGLPTVALATWISLALAPPIPYRIGLRGLLGFIGYFIRESLRGGWDVAMRTLSPSLRIEPGEMHYRADLPPGLPMVLFAGSISLLPGTLAQGLDGRHLSIHLLDRREPQLPALRELEQRIVRLLGIRQEVQHD